jgi:putative ABC transport system permease protein
MSFLPLAVRQVRAIRGVLATLGLLVLVTTFVVSAAPAALARVYNSAVHDLLDRTPAIVKDVRVIARPVPGVGPSGSAQLVAPQSVSGIEMEARFLTVEQPPRLASEVQPATYIVRTLQRETSGNVLFNVSQSPSKTPNLHLASELRDGFEDNVRYISGGAPTPPGSYVLRGGGEPPKELPRLDIVLSARTAETARLSVGDVAIVDVSDVPVAAFRVSGLFEPVDPDSSYWAFDQQPLAASIQAPPGDPGGDPLVIATGVIGPDSYPRWFKAIGSGVEFVWRFPPDQNKILASDTGPVVEAIDQYTLRVSSSGSSTLPTRLETGLGDVVSEFAGQLRTAKAVMGVAVVGLLAVALVVVALAARLVAERRRDSFALVRARGSSLRQLVLLVLTETAMVTVPAAALGYAAAMLTVGTTDAPASWRLALLVLTLTLAFAVGNALYQHWRAGRVQRRDIVAVRPSKRRVVLEGLTVLLAVLGVVLLNRRGLTTRAADQGADPFLVAVPVLLGLAAGLLALRLYPYPLRWLGGLVGRWRSAVPFLGVARASRETLASTLPLLAVLLGLGLGVFGSLLDQGLARAQENRAWRDAGADIQVRKQGIEPAQIERIRELSGITAVVPAVINDDGVLRGAREEPVVAVAIDLDAYRTLVAGSPLSAPEGNQSGGRSDGRLHILVSPRLEETPPQGGRLLLDWPSLGVREEVLIDGPVDAFPTLENAPALAVAPYRTFVNTYDAPMTNALFIGGTGDLEQIRKIVGSDAFITGREQRFKEIHESPLANGVRNVFAAGVLVLGAFCALAILLALVVGAESRSRAVAYLRTLGLSRRQSRGLVLLEVGPLVALAVLGGLVLGLILPHVVGPAVDLRPYTGGERVTGYPVAPFELGVLVGGLVGLAAVAILVEVAVNRRRGLGATLRVGE